MCKYANMWIQSYYFYYCMLNSLIAASIKDPLRYWDLHFGSVSLLLKVKLFIAASDDYSFLQSSSDLKNMSFQYSFRFFFCHLSAFLMYILKIFNYFPALKTQITELSAFRPHFLQELHSLVNCFPFPGVWYVIVWGNWQFIKLWFHSTFSKIAIL